MSTRMFSLQEGAGAKAVRGFAKILAVMIILVVAGLGDVMYIIEMSKIFAGQGVLLIFCYLGAFTSFMAVGYLLLGKSAVFRPGPQMLAAWIVFGTELLIIALNIMLVFSSDRTGFLGAWAYISPATPVFHMLGVSLIYFLDPELKEKHREMEMDAAQRQANRDYEHEVATARLNIKRKHLEHTVRELGAAVNSEASINAIRRHAIAMNEELLIDMSGRALPMIDESKVIEGEVKTLAQEAEVKPVAKKPVARKKTRKSAKKKPVKQAAV